MFAMFINDVFMDFWGNAEGDIFLDRTCQKMGISQSSVDLAFYNGISSKPLHFEFDSSKNLLIQSVSLSNETVYAVDENGNQILDGSGNPIPSVLEVSAFTTIQTISPDPFFTKGIIVKSC